MFSFAVAFADLGLVADRSFKAQRWPSTLDSAGRLNHKLWLEFSRLHCVHIRFDQDWGSEFRKHKSPRHCWPANDLSKRTKLLKFITGSEISARLGGRTDSKIPLDELAQNGAFVRDAALRTMFLIILHKKSSDSLLDAPSESHVTRRELESRRQKIAEIYYKAWSFEAVGKFEGTQKFTVSTGINKSERRLNCFTGQTLKLSCHFVGSRAGSQSMRRWQSWARRKAGDED